MLGALALAACLCAPAGTATALAGAFGTSGTHAAPTTTAHHKTRRATHGHGFGRHHACPHARLRPTRKNLNLIRAATLCLVNRERAIHGERPLRPNRRLRRAAQGHSASMASNDYFAHVGPRGQTLLARMRSAGYIYSSRVGYEVGENIGWGTLNLATPREIVAAWMASPGHRANILDANFRDTAIGVSSYLPSSLGRGQPGAIYTQDFGVIITG